MNVPDLSIALLAISSFACFFFRFVLKTKRNRGDELPYVARNSPPDNDGSGYRPIFKFLDHANMRNSILRDLIALDPGLIILAYTYGT
ncbi:hypothetical protein TNIN_193791 [Trichonephila inaurata madagascariensis]|uniref:Uncharacterized protein n=1 Tax=Trichonephila inaurata madagascariensis TaxID=2747483 RepID=A0A8X6XV50_9ARAC|nr:hypothetical protein TNIN_193791 [Trichonephila inaurata madagascariensis]